MTKSFIQLPPGGRFFATPVFHHTMYETATTTWGWTPNGWRSDVSTMLQGEYYIPDTLVLLRGIPIAYSK